MVGDDWDPADTDSGPWESKAGRIGVLTVLLGLGAVLAYGFASGLWVNAGLHLPSAMQGGAKRHAATASNLYYMEPLVLNGTDSEEDVTSFVRLTLTLELTRPEVAEELQARLPAVQNAVIVAAASRESRALRTVQGKALLRDELTDRINELLPNGGIRAVYFADFFIH